MRISVEIYQWPWRHLRLVCDTRSSCGMTTLFREIHKNAWLKRINAGDSKPATKKSEKFWVVFCVHDDFEALLEGYQEPRFAPLHQPLWTLSLQTTQHITHALVPTENDYEFVITLASTVARFTASSWDSMQEWVSTLRSKLREMKIISPKENLYSRLPEIRQPLLPTRDPMSPLPAPPPVPAAIVPGIEPAVPIPVLGTPSSAVQSVQSTSEPPVPEDAPAPSPSPPATVPVPTAMSNTLTQNLLNMLSDPIVSLAHLLNAQQDEPSTSTAVATERSLQSDSDNTSGSSSASSSLARTFTANVLNGDKKSARTSVQRRESSSSSNSSESFKSITPLIIPRPHTSKTNADQVGTASSNKETHPATADEDNGNQSSTTTNITIIQVSEPAAPAAPSNAPVPGSDQTTFMANIEVNCDTETSNATTVRVTSPSNNNAPVAASAQQGGYDEIHNLETGVTNISVGAILIQPSSPPPPPTSPPATQSNYEQVFIGDRNNNAATRRDPMPYSVFLLSRQPRSASHAELTTPNRVHINGTATTTTAAAPSESANGLPVNGESNRNRPVEVLPEPGSSRPRRQKANLTEVSEPTVSPAAANPDLPRISRQRRAVVDQEARKRSCSSSADHRNGGAQPPARVKSPPRPNRVSLREQQVLQLRREIVHPGGVRLQLRRKDCIGSIALVDAFSAVFIAGWKQKEHPMLYNALHIGDRLVSVAGLSVGTAAEVNRLIRSSQSAYIEFIVRRLPFGRVYAIRREMDGQCLGLIRENNTATIVDIIPNGLAARHGLPAKAKSCDGLSLTFWVLTEINGRPLNLFFKDNEIQDRLNAVGRDISILVQPLDLITKLKKQLKSLRGYKDFIVQ